MSDVLQKIIDVKRSKLAKRKNHMTIAQLQDVANLTSPPRGFGAALSFKSQDGYALICEIKKASPSAGLIRADFDPASLAKSYAQGGAACLSILTEEDHFQGSPEHLKAARAAVMLPVLRKDFMVDPYQIIESRFMGADCILLIMAAIDDALAADLEALTFELGMDALIEVHDEAEFERAMKLKSPLIGVNNRNLKTLTIDLGTTERIAKLLPADRVLVSESGLKTRADLDRMATVGARRFLIGESFMREPDVEAAVRAVLQEPAHA